MSASPVPNNHRPTMSAANDAHVGRHTNGAVKRVRPTVWDPRTSERARWLQLLASGTG
jgi:hypothetical protein